MKPTAIVYTSNTGYTKQYAELLGKKTSLPVYELSKADKALPAKSSILYLGWLMAGNVQGYAKAAKRYQIEVVCGVGMGASGSQLEEVRKVNQLPDSMLVFTLQGGFDMAKLHGIYKMMMIVMAKTVGKKLANKKDRTPDEDSMLELLLHGGNCVSEENLEAVLTWYEKAE